MHLTLIATGIKQDMDLWEKFMETRWFNMPMTDAQGRTSNVAVQSQLRPIQLYDFIFPKDSLDVVLNTLKPTTDVKGFNIPGGAGGKLQLAALRTALKLEKIPEPVPNKGTFMMPNDLNVKVIGVGIREDRDNTMPNSLTHEAI